METASNNWPSRLFLSHSIPTPQQQRERGVSILSPYSDKFTVNYMATTATRQNSWGFFFFFNALKSELFLSVKS